MKRVVPLLIAAALALPTWAHEGEDHGAPAPPAAATEVAPRAATVTETFGVLVAARHGGLVLYLDRSETNEPVTGARIEVESGASRTVARPEEPGVYWLETQHFAPPGKYPMTIAVEADDAADLMSVTLEVPAQATATPSPTHSISWDRAALWGASGALLLAGVGFVAVRRRSRNLRIEETTR
ncbi:MAG: hypothetical protein M9885_00370 [Burkholderiaceae bacterium]|nr:hypothetical protein [Burkholderiaceae bacterium]